MAHSTTAEQTINGAFGELQITNLITPNSTDGSTTDTNTETLANVQSVEARVNVDRRDIKLAGSRMTHYKAIGASGEGSFTIFRVTSMFMNLGVDALKESDGFSSLGGGSDGTKHLSLTVTMNDPESPGTAGETILLENVQIWEIPFGFSVDDLVQQTITFTFQSMSLNTAIIEGASTA